MYATLVESTTAFGPARSPFGQANGSSTATISVPAFIRIPVERKRIDETNTAKLDPPRDAVEEHTREAAEKRAQQAEAIRSVFSRLIELLSDAELSSEPHSIESAGDLAMYLYSLGITERPSIFLLDNGNFQAVWRNDAKEQVSLQFFGDKVIQYAMFAQGRDDMQRIAGRGDFEGVRALIQSHGCSHLVT